MASRSWSILRSGHALLFGYFFVVIAVGSGLLALPAAWSGPGGVGYIDALFTAVSAACVTGLITINTADFTLFGQIVILLAIQAGGLGIITITTLYFARPGGRISLQSRKLIRDYYVESVEFDPRRILRSVLLLTFGVELVGALVLLLFFTRQGVPDPAFAAVFHAVSAFCNAGFSLFRDSLAGFAAVPGVLFTVMVLIVLGGLGFVVIEDVYEWIMPHRRRRLSLHSRIVLTSTLVLILLGAAVYLAVGFRESDEAFAARLLQSLFQSVTTRTAGFNSVAQESLSSTGYLQTLGLMFVGGGPGSTAGGIKVSVFALVIVAAVGGTNRYGEARIGRRRVPTEVLTRAYAFLIKALLLVAAAAVALIISESLTGGGAGRAGEVDAAAAGVVQTAAGESSSAQAAAAGTAAGPGPGIPLNALVFEAVSAFGTVGLSQGITSELSNPSKIIVILSMLAGRLGLISIAMPRFRREREALVEYPREPILIG
jgi:trk system potassium uptake protein TrkH